MLLVDSPRVQATQKQDSIHLLNHLYHLSAVLRELREQKHFLFEQQQIHWEQQHFLFAQKASCLERDAVWEQQCFLFKQQHALFERESAVLKEQSVLLRQLSSRGASAESVLPL